MKLIGKPTYKSEPTARQMLIQELIISTRPENIPEFTDKVNKILSYYEIQLSELKSINLEFPVEFIGKKVTVINKQNASWNFRGELIEVLCRDTSYSYSTIDRIMNHPDMLEEQGIMINTQSEMQPKIYHRLVLNDINQGILIIPYLSSVEIKEEQE